MNSFGLLKKVLFFSFYSKRIIKWIFTYVQPFFEKQSFFWKQRGADCLTNEKTICSFSELIQSCAKTNTHANNGPLVLTQCIHYLERHEQSICQKCSFDLFQWFLKKLKPFQIQIVVTLFPDRLMADRSNTILLSLCCWCIVLLDPISQLGCFD